MNLLSPLSAIRPQNRFFFFKINILVTNSEKLFSCFIFLYCPKHFAFHISLLKSVTSSPTSFLTIFMPCLFGRRPGSTNKVYTQDESSH